MIGPGQPLNFDPGFTDVYVYGLYGLPRLINDTTRIPHIRHALSEDLHTLLIR